MHVKLLALLPAVLLETICFATTTAIAASTSPFSHSITTATTAASSTSPNATSYREGRQGLFSIINFPNRPCRGTNNLNGTCLSTSECIGTGGENQGRCANGFGTCCFYKLTTCGGNVSRNQTHIQNPGFPSTYTVSSDSTCTFNIYRTDSDVCQVRLDFIDFQLGPNFYSSSVNMECDGTNTDQVTFTPAGNKVNGLSLCGYSPGHHVYIDMGSPSASPEYAVMTMKFDADNHASFKRQWNIMVSSIPCNSNYFAPIGCDQYFFGNNGVGVIMAFNYDQPNTAYIGKLKGYHKVCVRREAGMCEINYTPPDVNTDTYGYTINGNAALDRGRGGCSYPRVSPGGCTEDFLRIPQGTLNGDGPYYTNSPPGLVGCDRFCGKRLCNVHNACKSDDHMVIKSVKQPFEVDVELSDHPSANVLKGYKLNYWQERC